MGLELGVDVDAGNDDADEENQQQGNDRIGYQLERLAWDGAVLMQSGAHAATAVVAVCDGAQFVFDVITRPLPGGDGLGLGFFLFGFLFFDVGFCFFGLRLHVIDRFCRMERCVQIHTAVGAETYACRQLFATTVAKLGIVLSGFHIGGVAVWGIGVIAHDEPVAIVTAHRQALWAHHLTVVYHKFLL